MLGLGLGLSLTPGTVGTPTPSPPATISDLSAAAQSDTEVLLTFTPASGATSHEYRVDGGSAVACDDNSGSQTVSGLTAETEYDFEVRGVNGEGNGEWSNVATETTEAEEVPISAPVLTLTNDPGDPLEFDIAVDETVSAGMYWRMQVAGDAAFTTPLFGEGAIRETFRPITMADFGSTPDPFECLATPIPEDAFARIRVEREDDETSDWSNVVACPRPAVITSSDTANAVEGETLAHTLTADESVTWSIAGGADAADFEISSSTLRWASDAASPAYTGTDDNYEVIVEAEDTSGNTTQQTITVTVSEAVTVEFIAKAAANVDKGFSSTTHTFEDLDIGDPHPTRLVVVAFAEAGTGGSAAPSAAEMGGVSFTKVTGSEAGQVLWYGNVPEGTTGDLLVTSGGGSAFRYLFMAYGVGYGTPTAPASASKLDAEFHSDGQHEVSGTTPANGWSVIAATIFMDPIPTTGWTGATAGTSTEGDTGALNMKLLLAFRDAAGAFTAEITGAGNLTSSLSQASWGS